MLTNILLIIILFFIIQIADRSETSSYNEDDSSLYYKMVKFKFTTYNVEYKEEYGFDENDRFVYLGEILNVPGHCIVSRIGDGKIFSMHHTNDFEEINEDEI